PVESAVSSCRRSAGRAAGAGCPSFASALTRESVPAPTGPEVAPLKRGARGGATSGRTFPRWRPFHGNGTHNVVAASGGLGTGAGLGVRLGARRGAAGA